MHDKTPMYIYKDSLDLGLNTSSTPIIIKIKPIVIIRLSRMVSGRVMHAVVVGGIVLFACIEVLSILIFRYHQHVVLMQVHIGDS